MLIDVKSDSRISTDWEQVIIDTISDLEEGKNALKEYLKLADPRDVELATKIVMSSGK